MTQERISRPPTPNSVNDCRVTREESRKDVNLFLEHHHPRGGVDFWYACFGARYQGHLVGCVVLERPSARMADDGTRVEITRYGIRDDRPANLGSWLISRARNWVRLEGFSEIITYAGVAGNHGTTYEAAGFNCADVSVADGSGWENRDGRDSWDDYERRKYVYEIKKPL